MTVATLDGRLDTATAPAAEGELMAMLAASGLVLDMTKVRYVSSAGLRLLLKMAKEAKGKGARSLAICNVVGSMATREAEGTIYTHAGPEIGVASTKAFTTQLVGNLGMNGSELFGWLAANAGLFPMFFADDAVVVEEAP